MKLLRTSSSRATVVLAMFTDPKKEAPFTVGMTILGRELRRLAGKPHVTWFSLQLGAKKGLGAQKVSNQSFTEIERQAQVAEKLREQQAADAKKQAEESVCVIARVPLACGGVGAGGGMDGSL